MSHDVVSPWVLKIFLQVLKYLAFKLIEDNKDEQYTIRMLEST